MISSVTTTTVTTVAALSIGVALGALASAILIALLAIKEITAAEPRRSLTFLSRALDVAILPLLTSFTLVVVLRAIEILS